MTPERDEINRIDRERASRSAVTLAQAQGHRATIG
jgi:hypothetical protein